MFRLRSKHFVRARTVLRRPTAAPWALRRPAAYTSRAASRETNRQHDKKSLPLVLRPTKAGAPVRPERREAAGPTLPEVSRWSESHSRTIHTGPDNSVRLTSKTVQGASMPAQIIPFILPANTAQGASMPAQIILFILPANTVQGASMPAQIIPFVLPANTVQGASMPAQIIPFVLPASDVLAHFTRNHDDCQL